jgi:hypothetical protein
MKTLLPLFLIIALAGACSSVPDDVRFSGQNSTATEVVNVSIRPGMTATQVSSQTPTATSSVTATPSLTSFPSLTLPPDCGKSNLGQPGTQKLNDSTAPSVLVQGIAILCTNNVILTGDETFVIDQEAMLDLVTGKANPEHADVVFDVLGRMNFYSISDFNEAVSQSWSLEVEGLQVKQPPQPTYDQCKAQYINPNQTDNEPAYLCVITNEGHVSRVKVEKFNPIEGVQSIEISFVTWNEIVVHQ